MSALLLTTSDEVSALVPLQAQFSTVLITPHLKRAQREFLRPAIGRALLTRLTDHIATEESDPATIDELLELAQEALAHRAVLLALPYLTIDISNAGLQIPQGEGYRPPYQWQVGDLSSALDAASMNAIEELYAFLEENSGEFPEWTSSDECTLYNDTLIRNAREFDEHYAIGGSRVTFLDLKPSLRSAQTLLLGNRIGSAFLADLLAHMESSDDDDTLDTAIDKFRPALANLAISEAKGLVFRYSNGALLSTRLNPNANTKQSVIDDRLTHEMLGTIRQKAYDQGMSFLAVALAWCNENVDDLPDSFAEGPGYVAEADNDVTTIVEARLLTNDGGMML